MIGSTRTAETLAHQRADDQKEAAAARSTRAARAGRAPKLGQRGVRLNPRDHDAFTTLFFVDWMDAAGLRILHYQTASHQRVLNRLNQILTDPAGHLVKITMPVQTESMAPSGPRLAYSNRTFYALSKKARASVGRRLERQGLDASTLFATRQELSRNNPEFEGLDEPDTERANHLKKVSDLYVELMPRLFAAIGPPGPTTWFWRNERRSHRPYYLGSQFYSYRPDAEVVVAMPSASHNPSDTAPAYAMLLIEVQTEASHKGPNDIEEKVASYARTFAADSGAAREPTALYWAAETEAHKNAAFAAAERHGVPSHTAGSSLEVVEAIVEDAQDPASLR